MPLTKITTESDLPAANTAKEFPCGDKEICIANVNGVYSAIDNVCLHVGGPLGEGTIENGKVVCPWHGYEYDLSTGCHPGDPSLQLTPVKVAVRDGQIYVSVPG